MIVEVPEVEEVSDDVHYVQQENHVSKCLVKGYVLVQLATDAASAKLWKY